MAANVRSLMMSQNENRLAPVLQDRRLVAVSLGAILLVGWAVCAGYIAGRLITSERYRQAMPTDRPAPSKSVNLDSSTQWPASTLAAAGLPSASAAEAQATPSAPVARAAEPKPPSLPMTAEPGGGGPGQARGQSFLQVAAVDRGVAEVFVEVLARKGFRARMAEGPDAKTFRVLVGPLEKTEIPETKSALDQAGLTAFVRTY
jgi:hypothetical protein